MYCFPVTIGKGTAISSYWRTKLSDWREFSGQLGFNTGVHRKTVQKTEWDISDTTPQPQVQIGTSPTLLGTITYDTAQAVADDDFGIKKVHHSANRSGRYITFKMTNDSGNASYNVAQFTPYFEVRGDNR